MSLNQTTVNKEQPKFSCDSTLTNVSELKERFDVLEKVQLSLRIDNSAAICIYEHSRDKIKVMSDQIIQMINNNHPNDEIAPLRELLVIEQKSAIAAFREKTRIQMLIPNVDAVLETIRERLAYLKGHPNYEK